MAKRTNKPPLTAMEVAAIAAPKRDKIRRHLPPAMRAHMFKPGQSGNPAGRPVGGKGTKPLTNAYKNMLQQPCPLDPLAVKDEEAGEWIVPPRTWAVVIAEGQGQAAIKGNTFAAKEIADRTEGQTLKGVNVTMQQGGVQSLSREDLTQLVLTGRLPGERLELEDSSGEQA